MSGSPPPAVRPARPSLVLQVRPDRARAASLAISTWSPVPSTRVASGRAAKASAVKPAKRAHPNDGPVEQAQAWRPTRSPLAAGALGRSAMAGSAASRSISAARKALAAASLRQPHSG